MTGETEFKKWEINKMAAAVDEGFISVISVKNRISEHIHQHFNSSNYRLSEETKFLGKQEPLALTCM